MWFRFSLLAYSFLLLHFPPVWGQVNDEIQVSASFQQFLNLTVEIADVDWEFNTIEEYTNGLWPVKTPIPFRVHASVNFRIDITNTRFISAQGDELPLENIGYRLEPYNNDIQDDYQIRYNWGSPDGGNVSARLSGIYVASLSPKTILIPGSAGNAGSNELNYWKIRIGVASPNIRNITGLPTLLDQNITPGTYVTILSLSAMAEP